MIPLLAVLSGFAQQETRALTLQEVIDIASRQSLDAFRNKNMFLYN